MKTKKERYITKGFRIVYSCAPVMTCITFVLILILGLDQIINLLLLRGVVNKVIDIVANGGTYQQVFTKVLLMVVVMVFFPILIKIVDLLQLRLNQKVNIKAKGIIANKLNRIDYVNFENADMYDLCTRVEEKSQTEISQTVLSTAEFLKNIIATVALAIIIIKIAWWTLPFSFASVLPMILIKLKKEDETHKAEEERAIYNRIARYISGLFIDKVSTKEIRLFNNYDYLQDKWERYTTESDERERSIQTKAAKRAANINMIYAWAGSPISFLVLYCVAKKYITFGDYLILGNALSILGLLLTYNLSNSFGKMRKLKYFWIDYDKFMNIEEHNLSKNDVKLDKIDTLCFENVYFTYPGGKKPVLNGVSFIVHHGEKVVIVGENGAGKSTIIKLALGLFRPDSGNVTINGHEAYELVIKQSKILCHVYSKIIRSIK